MKLRWSNGRDYADTFHANDVDSFKKNGLSSLRAFRAATYRNVHNGKLHQNELWFDHPELHIEIEPDRWINPGTIKQSDGPSQWSYFDPFRIIFRTNQSTSLEEIFDKDQQLIDRSAKTIWEGCYDAWRWSNALNDLVTSVEDALPRGDA